MTNRILVDTWTVKAILMRAKTDRRNALLSNRGKLILYPSSENMLFIDFRVRWGKGENERNIKVKENICCLLCSSQLGSNQQPGLCVPIGNRTCHHRQCSKQLSHSSQDGKTILVKIFKELC